MGIDDVQLSVGSVVHVAPWVTSAGFGQVVGGGGQ
jgi:hypothetical protein